MRRAVKFRQAAQICAVAWSLSAVAAGSAEVVLTGVDSDLRKTLRAGSLLVEQTLTEGAQPSSTEILSAAQADYRRLLAVLYDRGYFGAVIEISIDGREAATIPPVSPPRTIQSVRISVDPGPQFRFAKTRIAPLAEGTEIPKEFSPGEVASLGVLKETVAAGVKGWRAKGHAKAELSSQELTARHQDRTVNAALQLAPGPRLRFGPLVIANDSAVRRDRILEIAALPEGAVFSPDELDMATARLRRTGAFSAVALIEAQRIGPNDTLPIEAQLTDAPPRRLGFGAEVGTQEGLTVSAFWMHRNLLGGAERLRVEGEVTGIGGASGGTDYRLGVRFDRPATFNEDTDFYALAEIEQLDEVSFFSRNIEVEAGIERIASLQRTYRFGIGLRRAETRDVFGTRLFTLLTFPTGLTFDFRDNKLNAKEGYYVDASVKPFVALSGSDDGVRAYLDARYYRTFGDARPVTFALRGQLGAVAGPDLTEAPADYLFYSGGGGTVRGQPYQALGVDLGGGNVTGGRSFVGLSAELRVKATDKIDVVGFADAGYIGAEAFYDGTGEWHTGAGLGLRYNTGIGPIRLDVAVPTSGPEVDDKFQLYIGIGQSF